MPRAGVLLILGGGEDQIALIDRANEKGYETHVVDSNFDPPGRARASHFHRVSFRELDLMLPLASRIQPKGVCSTSDAAVLAVSLIAEHLGLVGNSQTAAKLVTDKGAMRTALREHGVPAPLVVASPEREARAELHFPLVVKPVDRSGSRGVRTVTDPHELGHAMNLAMGESFCGSVVVEEYISGRQFDVPMISQGGRHHCLAVIEEFYDNPPFFVGRQFLAPAPVSSLLEDRLRDTARAALSALGIEWGASHCEMRVTSNGEIKVIEVGGRMGGDAWPRIVQHVTGIDYLGMMLDITVGKRLVIAPSSYRGALLFRYIYERSDVEALNYIRERHGSQLHDVTVNGPPSRGPITGFGQKVGQFFLSAPDPESCLRMLEEARGGA